jgi:hypothetical protein
MKVFLLIQRTSVDYEGSSDEVLHVFSTITNAELALLNELKNCKSSSDIEFFINAYNVEE